MSKFKDFIKHLLEAIASLWHSLSAEVKKDATLASQLLNDIKEGKLYEDVVSLLPEDVQVKVAKFLNSVNGVVVEAGTAASNETIWQALAKAINTHEGLHRNVFLNSLSLYLTDALSDGKLDWDDLIMLPKWVYDNVINKPADNPNE